MPWPCTGVILAGGLSKRFGGRNKAFIRIGGQRNIDRLMNVYAKLFDQIILVTNDPAAYMDVDALIVTDHYTQRSSLNGVYAGLFAARHEYAFFAACDAPFVKPEMIALVLDQIDGKADLIVPSTDSGYEPMFAVYRKTCLPAMVWQLERDLLKIKGLFRKVRVKAVAEGDLRTVDPELVSFFNMNTPDDLVKAEALYQANC
ncbi:Molybdenum cofactor guanylyltransferase [Desulfosarcina cetonica]|nr:Molybdenum cofactor guanylyltransferase [Desulfosarcina cetonica]